MLGIVKAEFVAWAKAYEGPPFHAVLSDPPYGLKFMGKDWDRVSAKEWGEAMLPLLYPGAIVFMFGGTRTWHKLATGMEEAGFEIWDTLMWLHGQGFPKAQAIDKLIDRTQGVKDSDRPVIGEKLGADRLRNQTKGGKRDGQGKWGNESGRDPFIRSAVTDSAKAWQGHKTAALKPAWEPILCFRASRQGKSYAELAMEYGSGALNVDGGRVGVLAGDRTEYGRDRELPHANTTVSLGKFSKVTPYSRPSAGRYPANLVLDEVSGELLDEQAGDKPGPWGKNSRHPLGGGNRGYGGYAGGGFIDNERLGKETGGPSRFFYCAKASRSERGKANNHPTVKPIALTKWLATLLLPPDSVKPRRLLVPFAGSGSEMVGAIEAGWDEIVGVEQSEQYAEINSGLAVQRPLPPAEAWRE